MNKPLFVVSCPIDTYSGYGSRSRDLVKALIELDKYEVKILPQRWGNTPWNFIKENFEEWGFLESYILKQPQLPRQPEYWAQITVPNEFQKIGKYNIGITAGIETTACAGPWIEGCNRMDLVIVSSKHSKDVFENTAYNMLNEQKQVVGQLKCTTPIKVLFEGADTGIYRILEESQMVPSSIYQDINKIPEKFAYLFVGHWLQGDMGEDRKNVGLLIKAFYEIFKNKPNPPALILKTSIAGTSYINRREIMRRINSIKKTIIADTLPNIYVFSGDVSDEEMNVLYNHPKVKAMISLTKGEGFSRPLLEFTLTGKPVIAPGWSGQIDFLNPVFSTLIGGELKDIHPSAVVKDMLIENSKWFTPDLTQVAHHLYNCYANYKEYKKGAKSQQYRSKENFSWNAMKNELESILNEIPQLEAVQPMQLQLPKLKKVGEQNQELPKIQLPKLKKL